MCFCNSPIVHIIECISWIIKYLIQADSSLAFTAFRHWAMSWTSRINYVPLKNVSSRYIYTVYCSSACQYITQVFSSFDNSYAFFLIFTNTHQIIILSQSFACWMVLSLALLRNSVCCRLYSLRWEWQWRDCSLPNMNTTSRTLLPLHTHTHRPYTNTNHRSSIARFILKNNLKINHLNVE